MPLAAALPSLGTLARYGGHALNALGVVWGLDSLKGLAEDFDFDPTGRTGRDTKARFLAGLPEAQMAGAGLESDIGHQQYIQRLLADTPGPGGYSPSLADPELDRFVSEMSQPYSETLGRIAAVQSSPATMDPTTRHLMALGVLSG